MEPRIYLNPQQGKVWVQSPDRMTDGINVHPTATSITGHGGGPIGLGHQTVKEEGSPEPVTDGINVHPTATSITGHGGDPIGLGHQTLKEEGSPEPVTDLLNIVKVEDPSWCPQGGKVNPPGEDPSIQRKDEACMSLLMKLQKHHEKKRPYSCSKCWESFSTLTNLVKHEEIHLVESNAIHEEKKLNPRPERGKRARQKAYPPTYVFDDVAVYFTKEEFDRMGQEQRELYKEVMLENYRTLVSLGCTSEKPIVIMKLRRGEDPYIIDNRPIKKKRGAVRRITDLAKNVQTPGRQWQNVESNKKNQSMRPLLGNSVTGPPGGNSSHLHEDLPKQRRDEAFTSAHGTLPNQDAKRRPYSCSKCGESFSTITNLTGHEEVHLTKGPSGERVYSCNQCGKSFKHQYLLYKHHVVHTDQKPFFCDDCDMSFRTKQTLQRHQMVHTGEIPFRCPHCPKRCFTKKDLLKHQKQHAKWKSH